jgi:hypothetical protein
MHCAKWDVLNRRYIFPPSIRCSAGQLISPFFLQAQITATWPTSHVLSSTTFDTLHTANDSTCRIPFPHSAYRISSSSPALSIEHITSNGTIYISTAFLLRIYEGTFFWIRQNLNKSDNYDGGSAMLLSQNLPIRIRYIRTLPIIFSQTLHPLRP